MNTKILGLDMGTTSLGYALIDHNTIIDSGIVLYREENSRKKTDNQDRRNYRLQRRQRRYKKARKKAIIKLLHQHHMFPVSPSQLQDIYTTLNHKNAKLPLTPQAEAYSNFINLNPYELRHQALQHPLSPLQLARIFYHLAQRRGFPKNLLKDSKEEKNIKTGDKKKGILGADDISKQLQQHKTLGAYLYTLLPQQGKPFKRQPAYIRSRYTYREMYEHEFKQICLIQQQHHNLLHPQHPFRKDLAHLLFYQRPKPASIRGKCTFEKYKPCALKSNLLFEEYRLYKLINNLITSISIDREPLSDDLKKHVKTYLIGTKNAKKEVNIKDLKKSIEKKAQKACTINYDLNKTAPLRPFTNALEKIWGEKTWNTLSEKQKTDHAHAIVQHHASNPNILQKLAKKWGLNEEQAKKMLKIDIPKGTSDLSEKAIKYILPYLKEGLSYDKAVILASLPKVFGHHLDSKKKTPWSNMRDEEKKTLIQGCKNILHQKDPNNPNQKPIERIKTYLKQKSSLLGTNEIKDNQALSNLWHHSDLYQQQAQHQLGTPPNLRNPIVNKSLYTLRATINQLIKTHKLTPDNLQVAIEMARELKKGKGARKKLEKQQTATTIRKHNMLLNMAKQGISPTKKNLLKYELWLETNTTCVYTGRQISKEDLFFNNRYDIEHIIPFKVRDSRKINLTLAEKKINKKKSNQTPYQAFSNDELLWKKMTDRAYKYFSPNKYNRFISEKSPKDDSYELTQKDINLTGYITKASANYLRQITNHHHLYTQGGVTSKLRDAWKLNELLNPAINLPLLPHQVTEQKEGSYCIGFDQKGAYHSHIFFDKEKAEVSFTEKEQKALNIKGSITYTKSTELKESLTQQLNEINEQLNQEYAPYRELCKQKYELIKQQAPKPDIDVISKQAKSTKEEIQKRKIVKTLGEQRKELQKKENIHINAQYKATEKYFNQLKKKEKAHYIEGTASFAIKKDGTKGLLIFNPTNEKNRENHKHHLIDAITIATTKLQNIKAINWNNARRKNQDILKDEVPTPWANFKKSVQQVLDTTLIYRKEKDTNLFEKTQQKKQAWTNSLIDIRTQGIKRNPIHTGGDTAHGQLHNQTYYGQYKDPKTSKTYYHHRVALNNLTPAQIDKIVHNQHIKDQLQRIRKTSSGKLNQKQLKHVTLPNNKGGEPVPVKKIRIREEKNNALRIRKDNINRFVDPQSNYLTAFYHNPQDTKNSPLTYTYQRIEAIKKVHDVLKNRKNKNTRILPQHLASPYHPEKGKPWKLSFFLQSNDLVILEPSAKLRNKLSNTPSSSIISLDIQDYKHISKNLYRVQKISSSEKSFTIFFRKHYAATLNNKLEQKTYTSAKSLYKDTPLLLKLNILGKITHIISPSQHKKWHAKHST